ncbi:MAG: helix-turn-helix transcriptional regulator [Magnetococcales bacterium]|nr:helix-turn-helix transcriptional regulator [Magnetococcales bacterium]
MDLTQKTLSERMGLSRAYIADVEAGRKDPSRNFLVRLTENINVSGDWLLSGVGSMFLEGAKRTIRDRLVEVLDSTGRDVEDWMVSMGMDSRIFLGVEEEVTGSQEAMIRRVEHVEGLRRDWLLNGQGTPFSGGRYWSDVEACERLALVLAGEGGWHVYLVTDRTLFCVVMIAPAWAESEESGQYEYTVMEVVGGAVGRQTLTYVRQLFGKYALYVVVVETENLIRLVDGWMGSCELLGRGKVVGVLDGAVKIERITQVDEYIQESGQRIAPEVLERACVLAAEDPHSGRLLYWLSDWLVKASPDDRVYLDGLLKRNCEGFGEVGRGVVG